MALTKRERREAWKKRTTETARALRAAGAKVTRKGKRTVPFSATVLKPGEIKSEIVKQYEAAGGSKFSFKPMLTHREQTRLTMLSQHPEQLSHREQTRLNMLLMHPEKLTHREQARLAMLSGGYVKYKREQERKRKEQEQKKVLKIQVPSEKELRKIEFKKWQQKDFPRWVTDFVGDPLKLSDRERKIVLPFYGKTSAEALQQRQATTSFLNYIGKEIKTNPAKIALFLALPPALKVAGRGIQAAGITNLITKIPHGQVIARRTVQLVSAGIGATYSKNVYDRVTEPVFTTYKDGKTSTTEKVLPNGDIEITTSTEQIPQFRKPTGPEQIERMGGIFATELAPLAISHRIINRGVKAGYKKPPEAKPKVKITTKIMRAGKVIKTIPAKIKTLPKKVKKVPVKVKTKVQKAKEARALKKRHEKLEKDIKITEKKALKEKVKVLVVKKGELKLLEKTRKQLLKDQVKAKGKERQLIQTRIKQVEREVAFKTAFKPSAKVVKLSNSTYNNISRLSKLKARIKALITKIRNIPASVAKRIGLSKAKEIRRLNILIRETDTVKSYIFMIQKGTSRKVIVTHLNKLPTNELKVMDTKTGNIIKKIESTTKDIELKVVKPSKKPDVKYKEVRAGKDMVLLQKVVQKQVTTVTLTKSELKSLNALNTKTKTLTQTKPKTATAVKTKTKQLQKAKTQIKTKQKTLLLYQKQLKTANTELKHRQKHITLLISKQIPTQAAKTRHEYRTITKHVQSTAAILKSITSTLATTKQILKTITAQIISPVPPVIPVVVPLIAAPKKVPVKKKKKKIKPEEIRAYRVKNPIPTLAGFLR